MPYIENLLIERLPSGVRQRFLERCEPFELRLEAELGVRGVPLTHAYFPTTGLISLVIDVDHLPPMEVGVVGRESMLGSQLLLGVTTTPWRSVVLGSGACWRIPAQALRQALVDMPSLQALLQRNLMVRVQQQAAPVPAIAGPRLQVRQAPSFT